MKAFDVAIKGAMLGTTLISLVTPYILYTQVVIPSDDTHWWTAYTLSVGFLLLTILGLSAQVFKHWDSDKPDNPIGDKQITTRNEYATSFMYGIGAAFYALPFPIVEILLWLVKPIIDFIKLPSSK